MSEVIPDPLDPEEAIDVETGRMAAKVYFAAEVPADGSPPDPKHWRHVGWMDPSVRLSGNDESRPQPEG